MLIDDLVEYCDEQYQSGECGACTGKDRCVNECDGNCKLCLDDIHFHEQEHNMIVKDYFITMFVDIHINIVQK